MFIFQKIVSKEKSRLQQLDVQVHGIAESLEYCAFFDDVSHPEYHFLSIFLKHLYSTLGRFIFSEGIYQYQKFMHLNDDYIKQMFQKANGLTVSPFQKNGF